VLHRASLTYKTKEWEVRVYADNIFDKYAVVSINKDRSQQIANDGIASRYYTHGVASPRKVGVETTFKF
jgi:outer membrane receptor protein involved in Fe transport